MYACPSKWLLTAKHDRALWHVGDHAAPLTQHADHLAWIHARGLPLTVLHPWLFNRLSDERILFCAAAQIRSHGGDAPGPNGHSLRDLSRGDAWSLCRVLRDCLRSGSYLPAPPRRCRIPKPGGRGYRTLFIQNIEDRIVARAAQLILQPVLDPMFRWFSLGFRPGSNQMDALQIALTHSQAEQRTVWVSADVETAFDRVRIDRLLTVCRTCLPEDVVTLVSVLVSRGGRLGIIQGSPLSPMLWNLFADRHIDRPFSNRSPPGQLLRYADDLLVLCPTRDAAKSALERLATLARSVGTPLKAYSADNISAVGAGEPVRWLGWQIQWRGGRPAITIGERAWNHLVDALADAQFEPAACLRVPEIIGGWLDYQGPCHDHEDRHGTLSRILRIARDIGYDDLPTRRELTERWQRASARWHQSIDAGLLSA